MQERKFGTIFDTDLSVDRDIENWELKIENWELGNWELRIEKLRIIRKRLGADATSTQQSNK